MQNAARNHDVIAGSERQVAEDGFERALTLSHVDDLVPIAHYDKSTSSSCTGWTIGERHVEVEQQRHAVGRRDWVRTPGCGCGSGGARGGARLGVPLEAAEDAHGGDLGRPVDVIEQR